MNLESITRRDAIRLATGAGISFLLPAMDLRTAQQRSAERPKSLITLWMGGGPSQLETWDPHPGSEVGGPTRAIDTPVPGLQIADLFPRMAEQIGALSVIRSLVSKEGDHERATYFVKTGYRPDKQIVHPAVSAIVTHELPDPAVEMPMHVALGDGPWPARGGYLGDRMDAFRIFDPGRNVRNLRAFVRRERQDRRLENLNVISNSFRIGRAIPAEQTLHEDMIQRALRMMSSEQLQAFEIDDEPKQVQSAYGDSRFGRGCLVARRLVETGVRAVEVTLMGFDTHAANFSGHQTQAERLDPAFAALIGDLRERELLESTVVVCIGEFGRTPRINLPDGRDHWPTGFSCVVGGGGLKSGVVIGETDPAGERKDPRDPVTVQDLYATILTTLGIDFGFEAITPIGRPSEIHGRDADRAAAADIVPSFAAGRGGRGALHSRSPGVSAGFRGFLSVRPGHLPC